MKKGWKPPAAPPAAPPKPPRKPRRAALRKNALREQEQVVSPAAPHPVPRRHDGRGVAAATLSAALMLAGCSATFSISGLTSIFAGATAAVICLGVAFEVGKLSAVAWLGSATLVSHLHRVALGALVAVLMVLNSIGVYGFLSRAHLEHALAGDVAVASKAADIDARIAVQAGVLADIDRRLGQIDGAVTEATKRGRINGAMALAEEQRKNRAELAATRVKEARALAELQVEKAAAQGLRG